MSDLTMRKGPIFSVVLPTRDRLEQLKEAIASLFSQDIPAGDFEIIVVDDGSTDGTSLFLRGLETGRLRVTSTPGIGPAGARNAGSRLAVGEIIAFIDDDCIVPPDWLRSLSVAFSSADVAAVGGHLRNLLADRRLSVVHDEMNNFAALQLETNREEPWFSSAGALACRAEVFRRHGGFDDRLRLGEDREFMGRLLAAPEKVLRDPAIVIGHRHAFTLLSFVQRFFRLGKGSYFLFNVVAREKHLSIPRIGFRDILAMIETVGSGHGLVENTKRAGLVVLSQTSAAIGWVVAAVWHRDNHRDRPTNGHSE
jgi:glycosyltransferase involved in cell wall biosynthesis